MDILLKYQKEMNHLLQLQKMADTINYIQEPLSIDLLYRLHFCMLSNRHGEYTR